MKLNQFEIQKYIDLKAFGYSKKQIFIEAKKDGMENFKAIHLLTILFEISVDSARKISHEVYMGSKK